MVSSANVYSIDDKIGIVKTYPNMVGVAQWLERCSVEAEVVGSNPITHPNVSRINF